MNEVWEDVVGCEGFYTVSNIGNVKRVSSDSNLNYSMSEKGYRKVSLSAPGLKKSVFVHRLVAFAFVENLKCKCEVNHINGIKTDNRAENLEWCTHLENMQHATKMGLRNFESTTGENAKQSKLTEIDVVNIRELRANNISYRKIAKKYNVNKSTIQSVINFSSWRHVRLEHNLNISPGECAKFRIVRVVE